MTVSGEHTWHPIGPAADLVDGGWLQTRLLGRTWTVHRSGGAPAADPPAWGVEERAGLLWLAPAPPTDERLPVPEADDPRCRLAWLRPVRCAGPAGPVADALHRLAPGAPRTALELRLPFPAAAVGGAGALLLALQDEDDDSTRVHAGLLLPGGAGLPEAAVAAEVDAARTLLTDHLTWLEGVPANRVAPLSSPVPA